MVNLINVFIHSVYPVFYANEPNAVHDVMENYRGRTMAETVARKPGRIQFVWEDTLKWSAFTIMCLHLGRSILMYFIPSRLSDYLFKAERWIIVVLLAAVFVYIIYTKIKTPDLMFRIRSFFKGLFRPEFAILVLFFAWSFVCTAVSESGQTVSFFQSMKGTFKLFIDDSTLFDTFVSVFIIFIMAYILRGNTAWRMMESLFHVLCAGLTVIMVYVLYIVCNPGINLPGSSGISMSFGRLGINCNPNTTGAIAEIILLMCLYMVVTRRGLIRWFYIAASMVHYVILILSNSRACIFATGLAVAAIAGKLCFDSLRSKVLWQRILIAALAAASVAGMIIGMKKTVYAAYEAISNFSTISGEYNVARKAEITFSRRSELWTAAIKSIFQDAKHFFFGVTPYGVAKEMSIWTESHRSVYTHNQFLEIAVAHGIPGLVMYLVWLVMIAKSCVFIAIRGQKEACKGIVVLAGMIMMLVLSNLMEATLMYYRLFMEGIFFLICGMVTYEEET